jgi:hypothetical protein
LLEVAVAAKPLVEVAALEVCYKDLPLCLLVLYTHLLLALVVPGQLLLGHMVQDLVLLAIIVNTPLLLLMVAGAAEITTVCQMMQNRVDLEVVLVLQVLVMVVQALWDKGTLVELLIIILIPGPVVVALDTLVVILRLVYQELEVVVSLVISPVQ